MKSQHWHCLGCGNRMHRELAPAADRAVQQRHGKRGKVAHVCGACKFIHLETPDGTLRKLTDGELAHLQVQMSRELAIVQTQTFPPADVPTGTMIIAKD